MVKIVTGQEIRYTGYVQPSQGQDQVAVSSEKRTLYLMGPVDCNMAHSVISKLEALDASDGPIRVVLNSEGGVEQDGYAIYDAMTMCRNQLVVEVYGAAHSIAGIILQGGDRRLMAPNSQFMIHNGTTSIGDGKSGEDVQQNAVIELAEQLKKDNQRYYEILSAASQQPLEVIESWCQDETYFDAAEAVCAGFADEVMKPVRRQRRAKKARKR